MAFKFIHSSDWHIAKGFGRFDTETASRLRAARLDAIATLAKTAREQGAVHVVVAGDVYDQPGLSDRQIREPLERMRSAQGLTWHLLPGNHDPAERGGIWERAVGTGLPDNVIVHLAAEPVALARDVVLLPAPLDRKRLMRDPTAWMDVAPTPEGAIRIGLAHGPVLSFGSARADGVTIAADRARHAGLDYLALGDWHGVKEINQRTWYSGTPEAEQFPDNEPGFALGVTVAGTGGPVAVTRHRIGQYSWIKRKISVVSADDLRAVGREVGELGEQVHNTLLELTIEGAVSVGEDARVHAWLADLEPRLFQLAARLDGLRLDEADGDHSVFGDSGVERVATRLARRAGNGEDPKAAAIASQALRRLYALVRAREGGGK